jgi:hypothetical protein
MWCLSNKIETNLFGTFQVGRKKFGIEHFANCRV